VSYVDYSDSKDEDNMVRLVESVTSWNFSRSVSNAKMWISKFRFEIECIIKI
jgi:hypothetical protein